jgi:hypothetical protein
VTDHSWLPKVPQPARPTTRLGTMSAALPPRPTCNWQGASGKCYTHSIYTFGNDLSFRGVNYIAVVRDAHGTCKPLYIGHTSDTSERFPGHEKFEAARQRGANEIHIHFEGAKHKRLQIETDLRRGHWTPLNDQPTPASAPFGRLAPSAPPTDGLAAALGVGSPGSPYAGLLGNMFGPFDPPPNPNRPPYAGLLRNMLRSI